MKPGAFCGVQPLKYSTANMNVAALGAILWVVLLVIMILYFGTALYQMWYPAAPTPNLAKQSRLHI